MLQALSESGLTANEKKSELFKSQVVFLGRAFEGSTKTTKQECVTRIMKLPKSYNLHSLLVFLEISGHFLALVRDFSKNTKRLKEMCL